MMTPAELRAVARKAIAKSIRDSAAQLQAHNAAVAMGQQAAEAEFTPNVQGHYYRDPVTRAKTNNISQGFNKNGSIQYNPFADALAGGFGSGVETASNGVKGLASSAGLAVGNVWARSVISGADTVLTKADFAAAAIPQIGSDLAKTALGAAGLLGPAGSGAMVSKIPSVDLGAGVPAQATIHNHLYIDGKEIRLIAGQEVEATLGELVSSISRQSG